jgi:WD40 repeat protein/TolB-like protein
MRIAAVVAVMLSAGAAALAPTPPALYPGRDIDSGLGRINDLAFSSDGRLLAAAGPRGFGIWDAQTGNPIRREGAASGAVLRIAFGAKGAFLALGGDDGRVRVVDLRSGNTTDAARHNKPVTAIAFSSDGRMGASGDTEGNIGVWDPERGLIAPLKDGGQKQDIIALAFAGNTLLSASRDMQVVTWDVAGKRALRRGSLQSTVSGRTVVPTGASVDPKGEKLVLGAQLVSEQRGGMFAGRDGPARPGDLRRDNLLTSYVMSTGIAADPVKTGDYQPEQVALGPGSCFAFFTSNFRNQPRLHVWGLVEQGDDLTRLDLDGRASAIAVEPSGHLVAVGSEAGRIRTWSVSGATPGDCDQYARRTAPTTGPTITLGTETSPLISGSAGAAVAVLRFETSGLDATLGDAVAEMIAGELANSPQVKVIERGAINAVLKEMEIQRSGLTEADAVKIGRGLNARSVLLGGVRRFGASTYLVTTRAVDVETQRVLGSREVTCENCGESDLPRAIVALRRAIVP